MNNTLHYEVKVTHASEVQAAYEHVKANNIKYYRTIAPNGSIYGWLDGKYVLAAKGQDWFENPDYIEPQPEILADNLQESQLVDVDFETASSETENADKEPIDDKDYKQLYEETLVKYGELETEYQTKCRELQRVYEATRVISELFAESNKIEK